MTYDQMLLNFILSYIKSEIAFLIFHNLGSWLLKVESSYMIVASYPVILQVIWD